MDKKIYKKYTINYTKGRIYFMVYFGELVNLEDTTMLNVHHVKTLFHNNGNFITVNAGDILFDFILRSNNYNDTYNLLTISKRYQFHIDDIKNTVKEVFYE